MVRKAVMKRTRRCQGINSRVWAGLRGLRCKDSEKSAHDKRIYSFFI